MQGGSRRRRKHHKKTHHKKHKKGRRGVVRRTLRSTKKVLKRARKFNKSLLSLLSPKRRYN